MPSKKRGNGEGSIFRMSDGSWRAVVSCGSVGSKRVRRTRKAKTRDDAKAKLREMLDELSGRVAVETTETVATWLDAWLNSADVKSLAESTQASYRGTVENHLVPLIGPAKLKSLSAVQIDLAFGRLQAGDRTRELAFVVLQSALRRAVRKGVIPFNPCDSADRPSSKREKIVPFTPLEVARILKEVRHDRLRAVHVLAFSLGMRQGEIFGLRWIDVDWAARTISIRQQACDVSGRLVFRQPKTDAGVRTLTLAATAIEALRERQAEALREGQAGAELVFLNERGRPILRSNFGNRHWKPLLKRLEIEARGYHHCRHTAASLMLGAGVPLHVVSQTLGHSKPSITLDLYAHLMSHQSDEAAEAMQRMLG